MPVFQRWTRTLDTQIEVLEKFGCHRIFKDKISGPSIQRPALDEMLSLLREGDTVVKRCRKQIIEDVEN